MLRVGIFGVGHLGKFHVNNWLELDDVTLVGFYDPDDKNAATVIEKYGLKRSSLRLFQKMSSMLMLVL